MTQDLILEFLESRRREGDDKFYTPKDIREKIKPVIVESGASLSRGAIARQLRCLYEYDYLELSLINENLFRVSYRLKVK